MAPYELMGDYSYSPNRDPNAPKTGLDWLHRFRGKYPNVIWLNPSQRPTWGQYWTQTYDTIAGSSLCFLLRWKGWRTA